MNRFSGWVWVLSAGILLFSAFQARAQNVRLPATEEGQWTMPAKDYANTRYSGLKEITGENAKNLRPVWTFSTGVLGAMRGNR